MQDLMQIIQDTSYITQREIEIVEIVLNAIKEPYKSVVAFEFERQTMFDTNRQTRQILLSRLKEIILNIADSKAKSATLNTKGEFITDYEALRYKRLYFITQILDIKDKNIAYFLQDLKEKAMV